MKFKDVIGYVLYGVVIGMIASLPLARVIVEYGP